MYTVICLRESASGKPVIVPIMEADEDGDPMDSMATFESEDEARDFCKQHILCKSSLNIIVDTDDAEFIS